MSDLLNLIMEDPAIKKEVVSRAKKAIKDIAFTKEDMIKIKTSMVNTIVDATSPDPEDEHYYEIQDLLMNEIKKIITDRFSE